MPQSILKIILKSIRRRKCCISIRKLESLDAEYLDEILNSEIERKDEVLVVRVLVKIESVEGEFKDEE